MYYKVFEMSSTFTGCNIKVFQWDNVTKYIYSLLLHFWGKHCNLTPLNVIYNFTYKWLWDKVVNFLKSIYWTSFKKNKR